MKRKMTTKLKQVHYVSRAGMAALRQQLRAIEHDYQDLRGKLADKRQVKDAEDYDLVEDTMRLAFLDKEMHRLQYMIRQCKTLSSTGNGQTVRIGSKVRLSSEHGDLDCMVVSSLEANPSEGRISDQSPLGRALIGKMANALVSVVAPHKKIAYRIVGIDG